MAAGSASRRLSDTTERAFKYDDLKDAGRYRAVMGEAHEGYASKKKICSRRRVPACRTGERIVADTLVPWRETGTDLRLCAMDPAPDLPVTGPEEERAGAEFLPFRRDPVVDAGNLREIREGKIGAGGPLPVAEPDADMLQDIVPAARYPRDNILDNALLVPAPFLAAFPALEAVLFRCHGGSLPEYWPAGMLVVLQNW